MNRTTMFLPVPLTDDELLAKAKELASKLAEADDVESRKKVAVAECKAEADRIDSEVSWLASMLRSGKEPREVEVRKVRDEASRTIDTMRLDTGEIVSSRAMTIHELQRPLFEDKPGEDKPDKDAVTTVIEKDGTSYTLRAT